MAAHNHKTITSLRACAVCNGADPDDVVFSHRGDTREANLDASDVRGRVRDAILGFAGQYPGADSPVEYQSREGRPFIVSSPPPVKPVSRSRFADDIESRGFTDEELMDPYPGGQTPTEIWRDA